ncbi:MAG: hypothetical protein IJU87_03455 [Lachnospiraceae bacterium]|nr:hypothetical protein [Lachnospiraceae bacterium]
MAKKFGKFLLFSLLAGAAAAGVYYYLKDRQDEDLFEDSDPDVNDELEEFLKKESEKGPDADEVESPASDREYVPLHFSKQAALDAESNIIGTPEEKPKNTVEKASETDDDQISTFSFSSFEE